MAGSPEARARFTASFTQSCVCVCVCVCVIVCVCECPVHRQLQPVQRKMIIFVGIFNTDIHLLVFEILTLMGILESLTLRLFPLSNTNIDRLFNTNIQGHS